MIARRPSNHTRRHGVLLGAVLILLFALIARAAPTRPADGVILLANSADPDSLRIARHYAEVRRVPEANIIALPLPLAETISWSEFVVTLWQPLQDELMRREWIRAIPMALVDPVGRRKFSPLGHRITALAICRGVPLRINHDPALAADALPFTRQPPFRTNQGSVDSELSLLAAGSYPINAFVPNPLYQNAAPSDHESAQIVKVSRLDAPSFAEANALVDQAVAAERLGLIGRAYVDIGGAHPDGDRWLEDVAGQLTTLGFDLSVDRDSATLAASARIDAPALYFGWYAGNLNGPFALPGFRFPPGAIALHIHSFSAATLRSTTSGWAGPLLARGVTATMGNVFEPYLDLTHRPQLFLRALSRGATLVEAAAFALPAFSWQTVLIGDPLYRPFAVPLETQLANRAALPPRLAGYAVLRRMKRLEADGKSADALALGRKALVATPNLALGLGLAQRFRTAGDLPSAAQALGFAAMLPAFPPDEWSLAATSAALLTEVGRPASALEIYRALLGSKTAPDDLRYTWLRPAIASARLAHDEAQARRWNTLLTELTPAEAVPAPTKP